MIKVKQTTYQRLVAHECLCMIDIHYAHVQAGIGCWIFRFLNIVIGNNQKLLDIMENIHL